MKLFVGLPRTDYQDLLRAVGALLDAQGLYDVRFWEHEEGIVLQGRRHPAGEDAYATILLTDDDLSALLTDVYRRRGEPEPPGGRVP